MLLVSNRPRLGHAVPAPAGEEKLEIKPDGSGYYIQLAKAGSLFQTIPEGTHKPTSLTFEVRAGEVVKPGDFVLFSYGVLLNVAAGVEGFGDINGATAEWRSIELKIDRKSTPATSMIVQIYTVSDSQTLKAQAGNVHFRNFRLI